MADEEINLFLELFAVCEGDGAWCYYTEWSHCADLTIEHMETEI